MEEDPPPPPKPPDIEDNTNNAPDLEKKIELLYKVTDKNASFIVIIEAGVEMNKNLGKCSQLKIAKEIFDLNLKDVVRIKVKGKNRLSVEFNNPLAANNFVKNERLRNKGYNIYIPRNQVSCKGLIRQVDIDFTNDQIMNMISSPVKVIEIRRLNRKVFNNQEKQYVPTQTILITFEGIFMPKTVNLYSLPFPVNIYIPPVTQCYACLMYGHTSKQCRGKKKCYNCSEVVDIEDEAHRLDNCNMCCYYCKSKDHRATSKKCPEFERQVAIKKLMAWDNISYFEANSICKKNYSIDSEVTFHSEPKEFPPLRRHTSTDNIINTSQRKLNSVESNVKSKRTYVQALSNTPKKRTILSKTVSYDKEEINNCLYFPNSRPPKQINSNDNFPNIPSTSKDLRPNFINPPPTSAEDKEITHFMNQFYHFFNKMPVHSKIQLRDLMNTNLFYQNTSDADAPNESGSETF